jgi:DNA-binding response OmpR family regulator
MFQAPQRDGALPAPPSVLLISGERVGGALIATALRTRGHRVFVAETAAQGVARLTNGHESIDGIVLVGSVRDATPDALYRWTQRHGFADLPIATIGSAAALDDPSAILEILVEDLPHRAAELSDWLARRAKLAQQAAS